MRLLRGDDIDELAEVHRRGEFLWLDLDDPDPATLDRVAGELKLHRLAAEDTRDFQQRPKAETYGHELLLVYFGAAPSAEGQPTTVEVHLHIAEAFVLTVHRDRCDRLAEVVRRFAHDPPDSGSALIYRIIDALTDSILDVLDGVSRSIDEHEATVFRRPRARDRDRMATLHRSLQSFRRTLLIQRHVYDRLIERIAELPGFDPALGNYYRDVSDHLWHAVDDTDAARDSVQGMLDTYSNEVQERLTIVATIFLPLTLVTGFFGQNFNWMIDHIGSGPTFWGLGVGGTVVSVLAILIWLARSGLWQWHQRD